MLVPVERGQLRPVHLGKHQPQTPPHRDVVHDNALFALLRESIDRSASGQKDRVSGEGIVDRRVRKHFPPGILRGRNERCADCRHLFAAFDETVVQYRHLSHDTVHAVLPLVSFRSVNQIPPRTLCGLDETPVHAQLLTYGLVRNGLCQRHQSATLAAVQRLQFLANLLTHPVFLDLAVAVVQHAHYTVAALRQRSIESSKEHTAVGN